MLVADVRATIMTLHTGRGMHSELAQTRRTVFGVPQGSVVTRRRDHRTYGAAVVWGRGGNARLRRGKMGHVHVSLASEY